MVRSDRLTLLNPAYPGAQTNFEREHGKYYIVHFTHKKYRKERRSRIPLNALEDELTHPWSFRLKEQSGTVREAKF